MRTKLLPVASIALVVIGVCASARRSPVIADETAAGDAKTVEEICASILEARRGIRSGEMLVIRDGWSALLWFPRRFVYESAKIGGDVYMHEESQVTLVSLRKPIDPSVFTLNAIRSLTPGTFVHRESKDRDPNFYGDNVLQIRGRSVHRGVAVWNGEKLVDRDEFEKSRNAR